MINSLRRQNRCTIGLQFYILKMPQTYVWKRGRKHIKMQNVMKRKFFKSQKKKRDQNFSLTGFVDWDCVRNDQHTVSTSSANASSHFCSLLWLSSNIAPWQEIAPGFYSHDFWIAITWFRVAPVPAPFSAGLWVPSRSWCCPAQACYSLSSPPGTPFHRGPSNAATRSPGPEDVWGVDFWVSAAHVCRKGDEELRRPLLRRRLSAVWEGV